MDAARLRVVVSGDVSGAVSALKEVDAQARTSADALDSSANEMKEDLGGVGEGVDGLLTKFEGLGRFLAGGALLGLASKGIGEVMELGELNQDLEKSRAYFEAYAGGPEKAAEYMDALNEVIGGTMTEMDMMRGANKLLSMGLAETPEQLATLAEMAVTLGGDTRTAGEAIEEFALLLANQSILRLDTFGISGAKVREEIEKLQEAEEDLSREQAFLNVVMQIGADKVNALKDAGVDATTATQDMRTAWQDLRLELAQEINTSGFAEAATGMMQNVTSWLAINNADTVVEQIAAIEKRIKTLRSQVASYADDDHPLTRLLVGNWEEEITALEARLAELQAVGGSTKSRLHEAEVDAADASMAAAAEVEASAEATAASMERAAAAAQEAKAAIVDSSANTPGSYRPEMTIKTSDEEAAEAMMAGIAKEMAAKPDKAILALAAQPIARSIIQAVEDEVKADKERIPKALLTPPGQDVINELAAPMGEKLVKGILKPPDKAAAESAARPLAKSIVDALVKEIAAGASRIQDALMGAAAAATGSSASAAAAAATSGGGGGGAQTNNVQNTVIQGDRFSFVVADNSTARLTAALIAERKTSRLSAAME